MMTSPQKKLQILTADNAMMVVCHRHPSVEPVLGNLPAFITNVYLLTSSELHLLNACGIKVIVRISIFLNQDLFLIPSLCRKATVHGIQCGQKREIFLRVGLDYKIRNLDFAIYFYHPAVSFRARLLSHMFQES